jgi:hypothetical protein
MWPLFFVPARSFWFGLPSNAEQRGKQLRRASRQKLTAELRRASRQKLTAEQPSRQQRHKPKMNAEHRSRRQRQRHKQKLRVELRSRRQRQRHKQKLRVELRQRTWSR